MTQNGGRPIKSVRYRARLASALLLSVWLSACGLFGTPNRPKPTPLPTIAVSVSLEGSRLLALPLFVAMREELMSGSGLHLRLVHQSALHITSTPAFPVDGVVAWRPDAVLLTRNPDESFRWTDLKHVPELPVAGLGTDTMAWLKAVLWDHGVAATQVERLSLQTARRLFVQGHLPWLVLPIQDAPPLMQQGAYPATFPGASTGPVPVLTVDGVSPALDRVLAALNQADAVIATTSPRELASLVASDYPGIDRAELQSLIATGQGIGFWPPTAFLAEDVYERGRALLLPIGVVWPDYSAGVRSGTEQAAFSFSTP